MHHPRLDDVRSRKVEDLGEDRVLVSEEAAAWDQPRGEAVHLDPRLPGVQPPLRLQGKEHVAQLRVLVFATRNARVRRTNAGTKAAEAMGTHTYREGGRRKYVQAKTRSRVGGMDSSVRHEKTIKKNRRGILLLSHSSSPGHLWSAVVFPRLATEACTYTRRQMWVIRAGAHETHEYWVAAADSNPTAVPYTTEVIAGEWSE